MPTLTQYTYSITSDFPGGAVNTSNLQTEIQASSIVTALDRIDTAGDVIDVWFKDALSAADKTTLDNDTTGPSGGLIAAHDNSVTVNISKTEIDPVIGGMKSDVDYVILSATASQHKKADYSLGEDYHIQGLQFQWASCQLGDYAWLAVIHPASQGSPAIEATSGQATVDVGASLAPYYNPANGAAYIEFWNAADDTIIEVRKIQSISGNVITLASNLSNTHPTTEKIKARYDGFSPVRGTDGISGGFALLGNGRELIRNEHGVTSEILAGLILSVRLICNSTAATRELAINFLFRKHAI